MLTAILFVVKQKGSSKLLTKDELKIEIKNLEERLGNRLVSKALLRYELDKQKQELDDNAKKYRDQILTKLDEVMGELGTMREKNTIGAYQTAELRKQVDNHEKRIIHLEELQQTA